MDTILKINTFDSASPGDVDQETLALIRRRERSFGPNTVLFYSKPLNFVRGEGCWLFDQDGEAYLDAYNNVPQIGHSHPAVAEAIGRQNLRFRGKQMENIRIPAAGRIFAHAFLLTGTILSSAGFVAATPALAEQVSEPAQDAVTPATDSGEIVVTAQRREQKLLDVPVSVSAVSGQDLARANVQSVEGITKLVPGLTYANTGPIPVFSIRGVTLNDFGPANESPIAVYVDDVYLAVPNAATGQMFDVSRIEVLRGPQGTLFGRNATGGLVQIVSNKPTTTWQGNASVQYGSYDQVVLQGAIGGPITDRLRVRLAGTFDHDNGWQYNEVTGTRLAATRSYAARLLVDYDITDSLTSETNVHVARQNNITPGYYSRGEYDPATGDLCSAGQILANACSSPGGARVANPRADRASSDIAKPINYFRNYGASETLKFKGESVNITSVTGYESNKKYYEEDSDGSPDPVFFSITAANREQFSQELRLDGAVGHLRWLAGAYYFHEKLSNGLTSLPQFIPLYGTYGNQTEYYGSTDSGAGFINGDYDISSTVTVTAAGRLSTEKKKLTISDDFGTPTFIDNVSAKTTRFTWKLGAQWKFQPDWMAYANVSTGFKSPAFNVMLIFEGGALASQPEKDINYEIGIKGAAFDRKLQLSVAAFYLDYKDFQIITIPPGTGNVSTQLVNADKATIYGLDFETHAKPIHGLDISFSGTLLHNKIKSPGLFISGLPLDGAQVPYSPKVSLKGAVSYEFELGAAGTLRPYADAVYNSSSQSIPVLNPITGINAYTLIGAGLSFKPAHSPVSVDAFVENLTNKNYSTFVGDLGGYNIVQWGKPRTWGVRLSTQF